MIEFWILLLVTIETPSMGTVDVDVNLESYQTLQECLNAREDILEVRSVVYQEVKAACVKNYLLNSTPKDYNH